MKTYILTFYMKSGNKIVVPNVTEYNIKCNSAGITYIDIEYVNKEGDDILILPTLDMSQIEAVVKTITHPKAS